MAPKMLQWYYNEALKTGNDFFVLPPSGHTYSYPSEMSEPDLSNFVKLTEEDAKVIGTTGTVAWGVVRLVAHRHDQLLPQVRREQCGHSRLCRERTLSHGHTGEAGSTTTSTSLAESSCSSALTSGAVRLDPAFLESTTPC